MSKSNKRNEGMEGVTFSTKNGGVCEVVRYTNNAKILVKFLDKNGYETEVTLQALRSGHVKNPYAPSLHGVGFCGVGPYAMNLYGKPTRAYRAWSGVVERCYSSSRREVSLCYANATLATEWHNFQTFAKWFYSQNGADLNWEIDKDLLVVGNKHYSPETCILLPAKINVAITRIDCSGDVLGHFYHKASNMYSCRVCTPTGAVVKYFKDKDDCIRHYLQGKSFQFKHLALKWKSDLDPRAFDSLMRLSREYSDKSLYL
jgi:hypothetical protein